MIQNNLPPRPQAKAVEVDYNTQRERLPMPEYGRLIQQMVDHCKTLTDRDERQRCANTIVGLMASMSEMHGNADDFRQKLWNHLACMANYELDIDYPVEIERLEDTKAKHERIPYPQQKIQKRHYGALVEQLLKKVDEIKDPSEKLMLVERVANQMKRDLGRWNRDAMKDEKVMDDIANYTEGRVSLLPNEVDLLSDGQIINEVQQMTPSKKKKKKN